MRLGTGDGRIERNGTVHSCLCIIKIIVYYIYIFRGFQSYPTRTSTQPQLEPQLNPDFTRVGAQVGVSCLNGIYFWPTHTSTSPAVTLTSSIYGSHFLGHHSSSQPPPHTSTTTSNDYTTPRNDDNNHQCMATTTNTTSVINNKGWGSRHRCVSSPWYVSFIIFFCYANGYKQF